MKRFPIATVALTAVTLLWSSKADANTITVIGGEVPTLPLVKILASGSSPISIPATSCCGAPDSFTVQATATGTPPLPSGQFVSSTIDVSANRPGTLFLWFTETGVTSPVGKIDAVSGLTSDLINGSISSVTLSTYISTTDGVGSPTSMGTPLASATFTSIGTKTFTNSIVTGPAPYSLQEVYEIVATGTGNANLTIDLTASETVIPEPAPTALLGMALAGLGLLSLAPTKTSGKDLVR